jgi:hypothetical protein
LKPSLSDTSPNVADLYLKTVQTVGLRQNVLPGYHPPSYIQHKVYKNKVYGDITLLISQSYSHSTSQDRAPSA